MEKKFSIIKNAIVTANIILFCYLVFVGRNQYIYDMDYLKCILFMIINCLFIYCYGMLQNKEKVYRSNLSLYTVLFFLLLISVTFFIGRTSLSFYTWWYGGQYKPFHTIMSQLKRGSLKSLAKNIFGNAIMLMPLSFLLMMKNKKNNHIIRQSIVILPVIIGIELLQEFTHTGTFDIDDILLNYLGTVIFTFLITRFHLVDKIRKVFYMDFKLNNKIKQMLFYTTLLLLVVMDIWIVI
ncbi:MAG: hypothetical protein DBY23_04745 [Bacillota bacterium]|nr:MAG: hypothetical protein DBY23_04745 [Bacillota bacterium]